MENFKISLHPWKTAKVLTLIAILLAIVSIAGQFTVYFLPDFPLRDGVSEEFNLTAEGNFPTLYSTLLLFFCAVLLGIIACVKRSANDPYMKHWSALSMIFCYLALDEGLSLHEHAMEPLRKLGFSGFLYNAWVVPAAFILAAMGVVFFRFVSALPSKTRRLFMISGFIYIFAAFGLEFVEGAYKYSNGLENFPYQIIVSIEEFLEMAGIIIFIYTLLKYLIRLRITSFGVNVLVNNQK